MQNAKDLKNKKGLPNNLTGFWIIITGVIILLVVFAISMFPNLIPAQPLPPLYSPTPGTPTPPTPTATIDPNTPIPPPPTTTQFKQYQTAPMVIDVNKQYFVTFKMAKGGEFKAQLYPDKAPITVNSFVYLSREGFFNGTTFHRVIDGFMAQGGDPSGTGMGGPGYNFKNEDSDLKFDKPGVLAMANAGRDTNGSQFFITFAPQDSLNGGYTIFGQVIGGMDVVNGITRRDPEQMPNFLGDMIESVIIQEK
jgi:cyclophilin family peptidyl-prolyl cis-trans isomerase